MRKWSSPWKLIYRTYGIETGCTAYRDTVDVCTRAQTYGQCETEKPYFHIPSHSSYFPYFKVVLVELWLIKVFPHIWRTRAFGVFRDAYRSRWVLTHIMLTTIFPVHYTSILYIEKTCIFYNSLFCTYCTWTLSFWEKNWAEHVNQVRLVKWYACKWCGKFVTKFINNKITTRNRTNPVG